MEPIEYLRILRRRWRILATCLIVGLVAAWVTTPATDSQGRPVNEYQATSTLVPADAAVDGVALASMAFLVTTGEVPREAAAKLGFEGDPALLKVKAKADTSVGVIQIVGSDDDGAQAARLANTFSAELMAFLEKRQQDLRGRQIADGQSRLDALQKSVADREAQLATGQGAELARSERDVFVRQYGAAFDQLQQLKSSPPPRSGLDELQRATPVPVFGPQGSFLAPSSRAGRMAIAGVVALLLGSGLALVLDRVDVRLHSRERVEGAFGLPVVAEIPRATGRQRRYDIAVLRDPRSVAAASYRRLRTSITLMPVVHAPPDGPTDAIDNHKGIRGVVGTESWSAGPPAASPNAELNGNGVAPHVVLVSSPARSEGKTTVVANLAAAWAETGRSVLVLSCDWTNPDVTRYLGASEGPGLRDALTSDVGALDLAELAQATSVAGVAVIPAGSPTETPIELLVRGRNIIVQAAELADVVIVDTGSVLDTSEASELASLVDAVVLTCRVGRTTTESASRASELLSRLGTPVLGVVMVGVQPDARPLLGWPRRPDQPYVGDSYPVGSSGPPRPTNSVTSQDPLAS